jgi:hypothetical protein
MQSAVWNIKDLSVIVHALPITFLEPEKFIICSFNAKLLHKTYCEFQE